MADRSFSVGTLAEILQALGKVPGGSELAGQLASQLLPILVGGARDDDAEVRSNSVFGLGALAEAAGPAVLQYPAPRRRVLRLSGVSWSCPSPVVLICGSPIGVGK